MKGIKKQNLVEVKSMANPPPLVKLATESVCFLLGETNLEWKNIRTVMVRDNFISTILNFNAESLSYVPLPLGRTLILFTSIS